VAQPISSDLLASVTNICVSCKCHWHVRLVQLSLASSAWWWRTLMRSSWKTTRDAWRRSFFHWDCEMKRIPAVELLWKRCLYIRVTADVSSHLYDHDALCCLLHILQCCRVLWFGRVSACTYLVEILLIFILDYLSDESKAWAPRFVKCWVVKEFIVTSQAGAKWKLSTFRFSWL